MTTILKLRQQESLVINNGSFKTTLNKPILMENGDTLAIKSVFLDTVASSGELIELAEDVNITMSVCRYFVNDISDQTFLQGGSRMKEYAPAEPGGSTVLTKGDGKKYWACRTSITGSDTFTVSKFVIKKTKHKGIKMMGGLDVVMSYLDAATGVLKFTTATIPRISGDNYPKVGISFDGGFKCKGETFQLFTDRSVLQHHDIDPDIEVSYVGNNPSGAGVSYADLDTNDFTMTVPLGVYSPTELAEKITDQMVQIDRLGVIGNAIAANPPLYPVNSAFLSTVLQDNTKAVSTAGKVAQQSCYCSEDGDKFIRFNNTGKMVTDVDDRFIGANQVELTFDTTHKKMSFPILHFPIYVNESQAGANDALPGILYEDVGIVKQYAGVGFTSLQPPNFWNSLGFQNATITAIPQTTPLVTSSIAGFSTNVIPIKVSSTAGVNVTEGFSSLDSPVQKSAVNSIAYRNPNPTGGITTSATLPILGTKTFATDYSNEGYYFVELDCGLSQSLVGTSDGFSSNKVHSVVGTYFQSNNYTSDSGSGSIAYTHEGESQLISNIGVRILNCNGVLPSNDEIGAHNTIFCELIKGDSK